MAVRQITTRLAIDGEQEYKKQLAAVNRELGNLGAEMKLVDAQFKGQANSSEALRAKHDLLKQSIEQQVGKIVSLQGAVEEAAEAYGASEGTAQRRRAVSCVRWKTRRLSVPARSSRAYARSCGLSA